MIIRLVRVITIISRYQLLTNSRELPIPPYLRCIGKILELIFYPLVIFKSPRESLGVRLREAFKELGPIYIKFGQTLSSSPSLTNELIANELKSLQDKLEPFDIEHVRERILKAFGVHVEELFNKFDFNPISAASIAQVHKAKTKTGHVVAVKILRPNIHRQYNNDIKLLHFLAKIITKYCPKCRRFKLLEIVNIFRNSMKYELDLKLEAAAASSLAANFKKDKNIYIPKIYWQLTTSEILTTEWIDGISIYDKEKIKKYNINEKTLASNIAMMFFNQVFRDGFFHADLHPGNILIRSDGTIVLLDFGIMGRMEKTERLILAEILFKFFQRDYHAVARLHLKAGYVPVNTDINLFAMHCHMIYEPLTLIAFKDVLIAQLLGDLFKITKKFGMESQPQLILFQKTMVVVEGIGRILSPEVNIWQLTEPWIKKWGAKNLSPEAKFLRYLKDQYLMHF